MTTGRLDTIALAKTEREKEIIRSLWREYYGLINEKYANDATWLRNTIAETVLFGLAIGQGNHIAGEDSKAIGTGGIANSFREIVLGSYAKNTEAISATEWNVLDLLFAMGNGTDDANRSNALEIFKSGLIKTYNALLIGPYSHGEVPPVDGMLQYTAENGLEIWEDGEWGPLGGGDGRGITSVTLTSTVGKVKTYTITFTDDTTTTFNVTDGNDGTDGDDGRGITSVTLTSTAGKVKTYTITFTDDTTTTFNVTDGNDGDDGPGVPTGGNVGDVIIKTGTDDYQTGWTPEAVMSAEVKRIVPITKAAHEALLAAGTTIPTTLYVYIG
ncbi:MAG: hypothetical protein A2066_12790 [Bacteroidetes bacterium GWB2_41_8]|nr:MAG: hypothetical protein A2066_12790 [Bacteroidetes bacterium GWB2_41_8]